MLAEPLGPLRGIFGPGACAHWAKGRRGALRAGCAGQSGGGGRGWSRAGAGRIWGARPPWQLRRALTQRGEALEGLRGPGAGKWAPEGPPPRERLARLEVRQFPPRKVKDDGAETLSRVLKEAGRMRIGDGEGAQDQSKSEPAMPLGDEKVEPE